MRQKIYSTAFYILLPLLLFSFGTFNLFNYLKSSEFGLLNLDSLVSDFPNSSYVNREIFQGDTVRGSFYSPYSNLGLLAVRFRFNNPGSDDILIFRIKDDSSAKWLYEASYKTDQFQQHKLFPFGFPIVADSKNKNYVFELESKNGTTKNSVIIDDQKPNVIAKYSYTKSELLKNNQVFIEFLGNKINNIVSEKQTLINAFIFYLPFIYFIFFLIFKNSKLVFLIIPVFLTIIWDSLFLSINYDFLYLSVALYWLLIVTRIKLNSRLSGKISLALILLITVFLIFNHTKISEKLATWSYLFLCITVFHQAIAMKYKSEKNK